MQGVFLFSESISAQVMGACNFVARDLKGVSYSSFSVGNRLQPSQLDLGKNQAVEQFHHKLWVLGCFHPVWFWTNFLGIIFRTLEKGLFRRAKMIRWAALSVTHTSFLCHKSWAAVCLSELGLGWESTWIFRCQVCKAKYTSKHF